MVLMENTDNLKKIEVWCNGPYMVTGEIPLVRKTQVVSEYGEPLSWKKEGEIPAEEPYFLCRCGHSSIKPFCDRTHHGINFDGTEKAPTNQRSEREQAYPGCQNTVIRMDTSLCTSAGFCSNRLTSIAEMATHTDDTQVRALAIAMVEHCPSGALTYALEEGEADIEADLPHQIAVTTEITSDGPILGPLWVTGGIPILRSDGQPFEIRNRVTLCNCGHSQIKPLCDGSHRDYPIKV
jgi:CDGSH-type Zn-finger protein